MAAGQIDIFGQLHAATSEGILADAAEIRDGNKTQHTINAEVQTSLNGKATIADIAAAKNELLDLIYAAL